jgi:vacuolar-type H+-ATPase subunit I/STV1
LCNATFNISTPGTYTLLYSNGNFTDTGSIIVEGSGMEWLVYLAAALSIALFIIAYLSKDPNLLTLCGMMFLITGIILIAVGFGSIQNVWTQSVGMIVFGIGAIFLVVPNLDWIEQMMR